MPDPTDTETLAEVLAAHQWHHTRDTHCACGFRTPLAQLAVEGYIAHVAALIEAHFTARIEQARAGEGALRERVEALFAGGPDTPCRTTWREEPGLFGVMYRVECVEVPMDDLRAALTPADPS